ncbi:unnamed protein product [Linum tenue]|uniref:Uncharacterized protein n=1 Tax=Linum tenue TaxID=586396 RepID=A0AAV0RWG1_9ROSI|nr:unnamed protein product [Linum tenue]
MMGRGPIRANALAGSQGSIGDDMGEQEHNVNPDEMMNGWGNNMQRDDKEPSEDFLNDDEEKDNEAKVASGEKLGNSISIQDEVPCLCC